MPADMSTVEYLSRSFTGKSKILHSIFAFIEKEFDGPGNNYLLINFHPRSIKHQAILKLRTAIFPRKSPMGTMEIMPVVFMLGK